MLHSMLLRFSIKQKFLVCAGLAILMVVGTAALSFGLRYKHIVEQREQNLVQLIDAGASIVRGIIDRQKKGEITLEQAKAQAIAALKDARFAGTNYYFIIGYDGVNWLHTSPKVMGTSMWDMKDPDGNYFVREMTSVAKTKGSGFIHYQWVKPGDTQPSPKVSYVVAFPELNAYIGTGEHMDDISKAFWSEVGEMAKILGPVMLVAMGIFFMLSRSVSRKMAEITGSMEQLASGDLETAIPALDRKDEIGRMAQAIATFKQAAIDRERLEREADEQRGHVESERQRSDGERRRNESERAAMTQGQAQAVAAVASGLEQLSAGNLAYRLNEEFTPDYQKLKDDFNGAMAKMQETMSVILSTTAGIRTSAGEVSQASDDLAKRTEEQASSLEESAATIEELTASVKASASSSKLAAHAAGEATAVAEQGGSVVSDAVEAMSRIEAASKKIADITSVIDGIAFQTNLLALNAAVEAARAGDAGKGFAVVASEVRTLAQRSGEASKDINGLIEASSNEVAQGVALVRSAGATLEKIVVAAKQLAASVTEISTAAGEQAHGIDEMSQTVAHMDEMTQQNAALAEESAASATSLTQQIRKLEELVAMFRTGDVVSTSEPDRLRKLAAAAFNESRTSVAARPAPARQAAPAPAPRPAPAKVAAGGSHGGWDEF